MLEVFAQQALAAAFQGRGDDQRVVVAEAKTLLHFQRAAVERETAVHLEQRRQNGVEIGLEPQAATWFLYATTFLGVIQHVNVRTPRWLGWIVQRPESHSVHHERGVHRYNYSDLPLWDIVFGTFRNPKDFAGEAGFHEGASAKIPQMLLFRDVAGDGYDPAAPLPRA